MAFVSRSHRLDIKQIEPTLFAVSPLTANSDVARMTEWFAGSDSKPDIKREGWRFYTRCSCKGTEHCIHYVLYVRFRTVGEAIMFKLSWM